LWKVGAVVQTSVRRIWFHFSETWPHQQLFIPTCTTRRSQRSTVHAMFDTPAGVRIASWWPSTGTWIAESGRRGIALGIPAVLDVLRGEVLEMSAMADILPGTAAPEPAPAATVDAAGLAALLAAQSGGRAA
jgi:hypothetical protein